MAHHSPVQIGAFVGVADGADQLLELLLDERRGRRLGLGVANPLAHARQARALVEVAGHIEHSVDADRRLVGVEAVVDKDWCSELLAREIGADLFIMATDAEAVCLDFGTPKQRAIHEVSPAELAKHEFPAGSMGPKVEAACQFALATGKTAAIGALADIAAIARGERGTLVSRRFPGITLHP